MSSYAGNARERLIQLATPTLPPELGGAPARSTLPHITLSPRTARGLPTGGLALTLIAPDVATKAIASAPGFTLTIFRAVPALGVWARLEAFPGANYLDQLVLPDLTGGMGLFFDLSNVGTDGVFLIGVAELD